MPLPPKWRRLPTSFPTDGATVWIKRLTRDNQPFEATWSTAAGEFTEPISGQVLPWWIVTSWRPL